MLRLFQRTARQDGPGIKALGTQSVALVLPPNAAVPEGCCGVIADADGRTRRAVPGRRLKLVSGETAWAFHPGPYAAQLVPFATAPEIGLSVHFAVDSPDPRLEQQRFDLYLASECAGQLDLATLVQEAQQALQRELAQGNIELPPCATLDEWNAFRAGFDRLLYTRFGLVVDDCIPIDLGDCVDYGRMLLERLGDAGTPLAEPAAPPLRRPPADAHAIDARALRRLFLELPCLMRALRLSAAPSTGDEFRSLQHMLQRLDLASLAVATMPALELVAPGQPLPLEARVRRARHAEQAAAALDEGWALLARFERADGVQFALLLDELDRILSNLERHCAGRRAVEPEELA
ncbi:MAG: hypothetical protein ACXWC4_01885 [Telluria sp.]